MAAREEMFLLSEVCSSTDEVWKSKLLLSIVIHFNKSGFEPSNDFRACDSPLPEDHISGMYQQNLTYISTIKFILDYLYKYQQDKKFFSLLGKSFYLI